MIRLDDLTGERRGWVFERPIAVGQADRLDQVGETIRDAQSRSDQHDEWVVMMIAYEAAPAFDDAMRTSPSPPDGIPFVWWQSFDERTAAEPLVHGPTRVVDRRRRPSRRQFTESVERVRERIAVGDVYQVNITERFDGEYVGTPFEMYSALVGVQTCAFGAYLELGERVVASASPEMFFRWQDDLVTARPMKGTAAREPRPDADRQAARELLASEKDQAENVMIVDLLRNDLGRIADVGSVTVPDLFTLERYETVWQLTSTVQGRVAADTELIDLLRALFPCGSITGAPKLSAMDVIVETERDPRGVYCGAIGVLAPPAARDADVPRAIFSVPIRTAVLDPTSQTFEYGSGGGITWSSDPDAEDREMMSKARILARSRREFSLLETMRVDHSGVVNIGAHLDRMMASAEWFGVPVSRSDVESALAVVRRSATPLRLRLLIDPAGTPSIEISPLPDSGGEVVRLAVDRMVTRSDDPFCCHKTTWRAQYDDALQRHRGVDDVVLVNEYGYAIETTIANLVYRIGDDWFCPPLSDGGLPGIGRQLAIAAETLAERSILAADLQRCDEIAVLNDLRGWRPAQIVSM